MDGELKWVKQNMEVGSPRARIAGHLHVPQAWIHTYAQAVQLVGEGNDKMGGDIRWIVNGQSVARLHTHALVTLADRGLHTYVTCA
jgi:hypothetical protein